LSSAFEEAVVASANGGQNPENHKRNLRKLIEKECVCHTVTDF